MKVYIKDPGMINILKHPIGKIGFIGSDIPAEWPDDSFTHRRLMDGDITLEAPPKKSNSASAAESLAPADGQTEKAKTIDRKETK